MRSGHIYILKNEGIGYYKIGRSTQPRRRIDNIQTSNPYHIDTVGVFPVNNAVELEMFLHLQLARYRVRLEWFKLPDEILKELLENLKALEVECTCEHCNPFRVKPESLTDSIRMFSTSRTQATDTHQPMPSYESAPTAWKPSPSTKSLLLKHFPVDQTPLPTTEAARRDELAENWKNRKFT